jgi:hypothetical protein
MQLNPLTPAADRESVIAILAQRPGVPGLGDENNMGFVVNPATIAAALKVAKIIAQLLPFIGKNKEDEAKKVWAQIDGETDKIAQLYGSNFAAAASAAGVDPGAVAVAMSDYLKLKGVNLTPAQLLAMHKQGFDLQKILPFLILGAGALYMMTKD